MTIMEKVSRFLKSRSGVVAVVFGMTIPVVVTAVGMSVDLSQTYLVRERLSHALDAAALAAAASSSSSNVEIEKKVNDFVTANYPPDKVGFTMDVNVENGTDVLAVNATARLDTAFMKVFGKDYVDVYVETEVKREVKAIEVAMVMDVTGSMATNNNIATLRTAATNFVNTMFDRVEDKNYIKIGLVPFATSVNVGTYGLGKTPSGAAYGTKFVNNPKNLTYSTTDQTKWGGCILEQPSPKDTQDVIGPWNMYRYCRNSDESIINGCDTTYNSKTKKYTANQGANYLCPVTPVTPLTNNKTQLLNDIAALKANGSTYIGVGLVWGYRLISPDFPFQEGVSWNNDVWKKAVILMTDGTNEMNSYYSAYGPTATNPVSNTQLDNKMLDTCAELKARNVLVYTITFDKGVSTYTKNLFKSCATDPSMWYDAPTQSKLIEVYQTIAKELSNLHLSK